MQKQTACADVLHRLSTSTRADPSITYWLEDAAGRQSWHDAQTDPTLPEFYPPWGQLSGFSNLTVAPLEDRDHPADDTQRSFRVAYDRAGEDRWAASCTSYWRDSRMARGASGRSSSHEVCVSRSPNKRINQTRPDGVRSKLKPQPAQVMRGALI